jgi:hypothetical protein
MQMVCAVQEVDGTGSGRLVRRRSELRRHPSSSGGMDFKLLKWEGENLSVW